MSEADIKLRIIRLIDIQKGEILEQLYALILSKINQKKSEKDALTNIESGYKEMSEDQDRETAAFEWIEVTLHSENFYS